MNFTNRNNWSLLRLVKPAVAAAVCLGMISSVAVFQSQLQNIVLQLDPAMVLLAAVITLFYRVLNAANWGFVLRGVGADMPLKQATGIWMTSEACRWLPGSLWSYGSRGFQAAAQGVPGPSAAMSLPVELILTLTAWFIAGLSLLPHAPFLGSQLPSGLFLIDRSVVILLLSGIVVIAVAGHRIFRMFRPRITQRWKCLCEACLYRRPLMIALVNYIGLCLLNGVALFVVVKSLQPSAPVPMSAVIGANAIAWLVGFFAFMAPGGLLVREGALATLLACWLPLEQAVAASVLFRVLQLGIEACCLGLILLTPTAVGRLIRRRLALSSQPSLTTAAELP